MKNTFIFYFILNFLGILFIPNVFASSLGVSPAKVIFDDGNQLKSILVFNPNNYSVFVNISSTSVSFLPFNASIAAFGKRTIILTLEKYPKHDKTSTVNIASSKENFNIISIPLIIKPNHQYFNVKDNKRNLPLGVSLSLFFPMIGGLYGLFKRNSKGVI